MKNKILLHWMKVTCLDGHAAVDEGSQADVDL